MFARIENSRVVEIVSQIEDDQNRPLYHESLVFVQADESVTPGMNYDETEGFTEYVEPFDPADFLAKYRYEKEVAGIVFGGVMVSTARGEDRQNYFAARTLAKENEEYEVDFKTPSGFIKLNASQIIALADAVAAHVQKCFSAEALILQNIEGLSAEEIAAEFDTLIQ
jgi:hypothetical protein